MHWEVMNEKNQVRNQSLTKDVNHLLIKCTTHPIQLIRVNFSKNVYPFFCKRQKNRINRSEKLEIHWKRSEKFFFPHLSEKPKLFDLLSDFGHIFSPHLYLYLVNEFHLFFYPLEIGLEKIFILNWRYLTYTHILEIETIANSQTEDALDRRNQMKLKTK